MEDLVQTYILKVNIGCCNACPRTLHKLLLNKKGVDEFEVNQEKSMVSITGKISLDQVLKDIKKKIKKNGELIKKESSEENVAPPEQFSGDPFSIDEVHDGINQDMHHPYGYTVQMPTSPYHHPYIVQQLQPPHHHLYTVQPPQPQPPYHHLYTVQTPSLCDCYGYPYHYDH